ncbi:MAG TPA: HD domain-containing phosphohydrolase [Solirubrobacterales bacterium]|nr:HD domain-containing phosphohydrolase [Solirubrobacterales bacterium]
MEPSTTEMPTMLPASGGADRDDRLVVASRVSSLLARAHSVADVATIAVRELHESFDYYLAVVQRLDPDGSLRVVAGAGPLAQEVDDFLALEQPVELGVNGRVARTGEPAMVNDTRLDSDYLHRNPRTDPGSELSLPIRVAGEIWGVMNLEQEARGAFAEDDLLLAHIVAGQLGSAIYRCQLVEELEGAFLTTLGVIADAVELQDEYTAEHAGEVAELAVAVGRRMGIGGVELDRLRYGALLHDVGKIGVPGELIRKQGPLTAEEREKMDAHTAIGARMLERIPFLAPVAPLVRSAHERVDGGGYPDGLSGEEIPRAALVIAACDAFHAMTSDRSYRRAMPREAAVAELRAGAGSQFDPAVIDALIAEVLS